MLKDKFNNNTTALDKKIVDNNEYWTIENNPMTKVGVFPYLGKQISPELEPNKIYHVLRPKEELTKPETLKSLESIPLLDEHTMVGNKQGFTPIEKLTVHGVTGANVKADNDIITNDLRFYSKTIQDLINSGKKELSMGYTCKYKLEPGEFDGKPYDVVQTNIRYNHIALVDEGRMGHDIRVMDSNVVFDRMDIRDEWITIHPNGKEHKGRPLYVDEGQSKKEAIQELFGKGAGLTREEKISRLQGGIKTYKERVAKRQKSIEGFISLYGENHKEVKRQKEQLSSLEKAISKLEKELQNQQNKSNDSNNLTHNEGKKALDTSSTIEGVLNMNKDKEKTAQDVDKRELIREVMAIAAKPNEDFEGGEEEKIKTIAKKLEAMSYNPSESGANDEDDTKKKEGEDQEPEKKEDKKPCEDEDDKKTKDEDKDDDKDKDKKEHVSMDSAIKYIAKRDDIVKRIKPLIGDNVNYSSMNIDEVVSYACDKLDIKPSLDTLEGYLKAKSTVTQSTVSMDSMFEKKSTDFLNSYKSQK